VRVIVADAVLTRAGISALLTEAGCEVVEVAGNGVEAVRVVLEHDPDVAVIDIRMPPTHTDEGLVAAQEIRERCLA
jgi:serine/threonine-protein kinase